MDISADRPGQVARRLLADTNNTIAYAVGAEAPQIARIVVLDANPPPGTAVRPAARALPPTVVAAHHVAAPPRTRNRLRP
jgi:hypothetical protein